MFWCEIEIKMEGGDREEERGKDSEGGRYIYMEREVLERDLGKREREWKRELERDK